MRIKVIVLLLALFTLVISACTLKQEIPAQNTNTNEIKSPPQQIVIENKPQEYNPVINPADFSSKVDNKFFKLTPGKKMTYESAGPDGKEKIEVYVMDKTETIAGIKAVVVWDRVWVDGDLKENTMDWYAQDKEGNVWYLGEDTYELENGKITTTAGTWKTGVNGAKPGIIMEANPKVGDSYYQEYYKGEAEDRADVLSVNEKVSVKAGSFENCIKTYDYTPLNLKSKEHKYYCSQIGDIALVEDLETGERLELIKVEYGAEPSPDADSSSMKQEEKSNEPAERITEAEAKEIALNEVPGIVTGIGTETLSGKEVYVVQIEPDNGPETDVFIDMETGDVISVET